MTYHEKIAYSQPLLAKSLGGLKRFFTRGLGSLPKQTQRGLKQKALKKGTPESIALWPAAALAGLVGNKGKVQEKVWKYWTKPSLSADIAAGNIGHSVAKHVPGLRTMFLQKQKIPVSVKKKLYKEVDIPSGFAPAEKAKRFLLPFGVFYAGGKGLEEIRKMKNERRKSSKISRSETAPAQ